MSYVEKFCPKHYVRNDNCKDCDANLMADLLAAHSSELAHLQKALNERELELLRVKGENERLKRTLAQPHMEWAAGMHSVGVDVEAEDKRLRARLAVLEPVWEAAKAWREAHRTNTGRPTNWAALCAAIDTALAATEGKP